MVSFLMHPIPLTDSISKTMTIKSPSSLSPDTFAQIRESKWNAHVWKVAITLIFAMLYISWKQVKLYMSFSYHFAGPPILLGVM